MDIKLTQEEFEDLTGLLDAATDEWLTPRQTVWLFLAIEQQFKMDHESPQKCGD